MLTSTFETITPEKAREYLEANTNNYRTLSQHKVASYASDISRGLWETNGEPIVFDAGGFLKDGQHRLAAIVKAGKAIDVLVVRGVSRDVQIYDWGTNRTLPQWGKASGYAVTNTLAGAVRIFLFGFHTASSKGMITEYIRDHYEELHAADLMTVRGKKNGPGRRAAATLAAYVAKKNNIITDYLLDEFFTIFNTGNTLPSQVREPSPALIASRTFLTDFATAASGDMQLRQYVTLISAIADYKRNVNRRIRYDATNDKKALALLDKAREMDGIVLTRK